jgi:hypothetical protein
MSNYKIPYKYCYRLPAGEWFGKFANWYEFLHAHNLPYKKVPTTLEEAESFLYWAHANKMNVYAEGVPRAEKFLEALQEWTLKMQYIGIDKLVED